MDVSEKGIIYYTDNRIEGTEILQKCREQLKLAAGDIPIVSVSLSPIDLGTNIVLEGMHRGYVTYITQILTALENSTAKYVFFCEHDCLYSPSHFDFTPPTDDIYYYNVNNYRWWLGAPTAITYDGLTSLSGLCCNRELAVRHYRLRMKLIEEQGMDKFRSREPRMARIFGYEPGSKKKRRGGVSDEEHIKRRSEFPNIDIRHHQTFSAPKITLDSFKHKPENWVEIPIKEIPGWDLKSLFPEEMGKDPGYIKQY